MGKREIEFHQYDDNLMIVDVISPARNGGVESEMIGRIDKDRVIHYSTTIEPEYEKIVEHHAKTADPDALDGNGKLFNHRPR